MTTTDAMDPESREPLLANKHDVGEEQELAEPSCCWPVCGASSLAWRLFHAFSFLLGGTTFIAGAVWQEG